MARVSFVEVSDPEFYRSRFAQAKSMAIGDSSNQLCRMGSSEKDFKCEIPNPNNEQCIDTNQNSKCDEGETHFRLYAGVQQPKDLPTNIIHAGLVNPFELQKNEFTDSPNFLLIESLSLDIFFPKNKSVISLKNPTITAGVLATHIRNFVVQDFNGDGLFDIAFELVNYGSSQASLKVYLQEKS